ncbi:MAG: hypothetical protein HC806_07865, partial [Anaerolineae bacterium]|nr:hypothetical protein [Anaerolineae bacterium]
TATASAGDGFDSEAFQATAAANATQSAQEIEAAQTAQAAISAEQAQATLTAFSSILSELPKYGLDPNKGHPGWIHPPVTIQAQGYLQYDYDNQFIGVVAQDFAVSADITWNTQFGSAGCGFVLRSDGNQDAFNQYIALATRGGSGRVIFTTMANGEIANAKDIYAYGIDPNFQWQNDTTNRMTIVARGSKIAIYTNDTLISEFDVNDPPARPYIPPAPPSPADPNDPVQVAAYQAAKLEYDNIVAQINAQYQRSINEFQNTDVEFEKGFVAMVALNESGTTTCQFNNAWLWLIEE